MLEQIQINAYSEFEIVITQDEYMRYTDEPEKKKKRICLLLRHTPHSPPHSSNHTPYATDDNPSTLPHRYPSKTEKVKYARRGGELGQTLGEW